MSDAVDRGVTVTESAPLDRPIEMAREATAAFVGRTLRGPLNEPVAVSSPAEFCRIFGPVWSRSSLGPAMQQFFAHGGKRLYIVRVANKARGAMICAPAQGGALVLRAVDPGSTEHIRAAIDYDGIDAKADDEFNLTLQRLDPVTGLVLDQEFHRRVSIAPDSRRFVIDALLTSALARADTPLPAQRPDATVGVGVNRSSAYVEHSQHGTDGNALSDYDLIGSHSKGTGLFALRSIPRVDILYLPPPGKGLDVGPAAVLAADRFCREHGAMLIVDPLRKWGTAAAAVAGVRELGYASPNMLGYFPRMLERGGDPADARVAGGAIAGLLCKLDRRHGAWHDFSVPGIALQRSLRPAQSVDPAGRADLARAGLNSIEAGPAGNSLLHGSLTLSRGSAAHRAYSKLPVRRLCLQIIATVDSATREALFTDHGKEQADRIRSRIHAYLAALAASGAVAEDDLEVQCGFTEGASGTGADTSLSILLALRPFGCSERILISLQQTTTGCRVGHPTFAPPEL